MYFLHIISPVVIGLVLAVTPVQAADTVPTDIQQPGTQPGELSNLESPNKCDNCHGGYNSAVEPAHSWRGSMMAHAGRDPIFWATVAIAEQDFDGSGDLCIRCHSTTGWLEGRSTPTDGSGLAASDSDGVDCDFCHKLTNPDSSEHTGVMNAPFIANDEDGAYYGSGMASVWGGGEKLGPYSDAQPKHQFMPSVFHRSVDFCGTCHDVSNAAVGNLAHNRGTQAGADPVIADGSPGGAVDSKAAFNNPPHKYGVVERTFSEFKSGQVSRTRVADFPSLPPALRRGALEAIHAAATADGGSADYEDGTPRYYSCQSCHMRPVTGKGANKRGLPVRRDLPLHDMTGGNYWMPEVIEYMNARGQLRLGGDMTQATIEAMRDGALRAREQLELAASLQVTDDILRVVNHTGHKLISGYPEGRRMWLNIKWFDEAGATVAGEIGAYGPLTVADPAGGADIVVNSILDLHQGQARIYEAHYGMTSEWAQQLLDLDYPPTLALSYDRVSGQVDNTLGQLAAEVGQTAETFHFVLNNTVVKDNRIPPWGMRYDEARVRNALPVPAQQYGGGTPGSLYRYWDAINMAAIAPSGASAATIELLYQPTSWEYIQFLALANKGTDPLAGGNAFLGQEGANLLDAWRNTGMAEPHVMASANWGTPPAGCAAPVPELASAHAGNKLVGITWEDPHHITTPIDKFSLYYDQAGKAQHVADITWPGNAYTDTELTNDQQYCYKLTTHVSSTQGQCESGFSQILCATPTAGGQAVVGVSAPMTTGRWTREGKGKNATVTFETTDTFSAGDAAVIRGIVSSLEATPSGAIVQITIGNGAATVANLNSVASNASGEFEVTWQTQKPNKKGAGGTAAGAYSATVSGVLLDGYTWDETASSVTLYIQ